MSHCEKPHCHRDKSQPIGQIGLKATAAQRFLELPYFQHFAILTLTLVSVAL
jgi:hypothetical protein